MDRWQITAVGGLDASALIILSLGVAAGVLWTWWTLDPRHGRRARILLSAIRAAALLVGFGLVLQPTLHTRKLTVRPARLAILVDVSESMTRGARSRLGQVSRLLEQAAQGLGDLAGRHRLAWYRFADRLEPVTGAEQAASALRVKPRGTDIRRAFEELKALRADLPLAGVVLLSDGADTEMTASLNGEIDAGFARTLGVPVNTVALTDPSGRKDLAVERVAAASFAFSRSKTPIVVSLRSVGLPDREVEVLLERDGSVAERKTARLVGGKGEVTFEIRPTVLGHEVVTVTTPVPRGDEVPENNDVHASMEVIRDKFRVLHLAGRPSFDQRFLRETLKAWPRIDLVSFYVLRTAYQSSTQGASGMSLIPFPTDDLFEGHLEEFDIVVFHDFDPTAVGVARYLDRIADFVQGGGALVLVSGGAGLGAEQLAGTRFPGVLPVALLPTGTPETRLGDAQPFHVRLTEDGARHPLARFASQSADGAALFRSLARLEGVGRVSGLAPQSVRLAEHPFVNADDGPTPVIAAREVGRGRSLAILTDSLWRWRFSGPLEGGPATVYGDFWRQAIAWLTHAPELERLRADVKPSPVPAGRPAELTAELEDEAYRPASGAKMSFAVTWTNDDGSTASDSFDANLDEQGRYRREWLPRAAGPHRLTATSADGLSVNRRFLVASADAELAHLEPAPGLLKQIAQITQGRFETDTLSPGNWATAHEALREIVGHRDVSLWDRPEALALFILLLVGEWWFRRRLGLR